MIDRNNIDKIINSLIYDDFFDDRGKLKAIEDLSKDILNRPNTENTRVNLKRAITDILDISKSGEDDTFTYDKEVN